MYIQEQGMQCPTSSKEASETLAREELTAATIDAMIYWLR